MYVDTNPFLFRGRVEGAMVRLSASPVVNVSSGGGEAGLFVIEGRLESSRPTRKPKAPPAAGAGVIVVALL
jgi:hypothetical protein